jgi:ubiquinone/menaquinone biosynthesis C-methylase UbiE
VQSVSNSKKNKSLTKRKFLQGTINIVKFNWHFYLFAALFIVGLVVLKSSLSIQVKPFVSAIFWITLIVIVNSLLVSLYVYDISNLYKFEWITNLNEKNILNVNAGFDETSELLKARFPNAKLIICDFYNPQQHTEVSIKMARKFYPPVAGTIQISTNELPIANNFFDCTIAVFSVHEIRDEQERFQFFKELSRVTKPTGKIFVTEHLRDTYNFIAYTIGFFHFYSIKVWNKTFEQANLEVIDTIKTTPFVTTFVLKKNATSS